MALSGRLALGRSFTKLGLAIAASAALVGLLASAPAIAQAIGPIAKAVPVQDIVAEAPAPTRSRAPSSSAALGTIAFGALPLEAQQTARLIRSGGPFPFQKDGIIFGNRERFLPREPRGYYREYTVPTPKARDRGARRIVCGGRQPVNPEACYYTNDHYASFRLIVE